LHCVDTDADTDTDSDSNTDTDTDSNTDSNTDTYTCSDMRFGENLRSGGCWHPGPVDKFCFLQHEQNR